MTDRLRFETMVGEDGTLNLHLPDDMRGKVIVTIEAMPETNGHDLTHEEQATLDTELEDLLSDESLRGLGLTAEEIAKSPEIGIWKDRTDIVGSAEYVRELRRKRRERRMNRD